MHCAMGCGRTGTMLACYLVAKEGYTADKAIEETRQRRRNSIETRILSFCMGHHIPRVGYSRADNSLQ